MLSIERVVKSLREKFGYNGFGVTNGTETATHESVRARTPFDLSNSSA